MASKRKNHARVHVVWASITRGNLTVEAVSNDTRMEIGAVQDTLELMRKHKMAAVVRDANLVKS